MTSGRSILVVEDDAMARDLLVAFLDTGGWSARTAADGLEGLRLALAEVPSLILLDLTLPLLDGLELARRLRGDPATRDVPVVALSGHVTEDHRRGALSAGCDRYLTKPVSLQALLETVAQLVEGGGKGP